jgi:hypothetical protein
MRFARISSALNSLWMFLFVTVLPTLLKQFIMSLYVIILSLTTLR